MARKKKAMVLELEAPVLETAPLLDAVIENTPKVKPKPEIPPGYEVLPDGVWYMRINKDYLGFKSKKPVQLYQEDHTAGMKGCNCPYCKAVRMNGDNVAGQPFEDVKVFGEVEVICNQQVGCGGGGTASVRLRSKAGSIVAVKR
jgi:hypothetical protein